MEDPLRRQIEQLRGAKTKVLKARYRELFGEEPRSSNQAHLFRRVAWRLQALSEGDLSQRARDRANELAADADLRLRAPRQFWRELDIRAREAERDPRLPAPGTTLQRRYQERTLNVKVLAEGFEYEGKIYNSLSSIASSVTGTRWNGFAFFGRALRKSAGGAQTYSGRTSGQSGDLTGVNGDVSTGKVTKSRGGTDR